MDYQKFLEENKDLAEFLPRREREHDSSYAYRLRTLKTLREMDAAPPKPENPFKPQNRHKKPDRVTIFAPAPEPDKPKRKKPANHNQRSREHLMSLGYRVTMVETYNAFSGRKQDLFGIFDFLAIGNGHTVGVQVTSDSAKANRRSKIEASPHYHEWKATGNKVLLLTYGKNKRGHWKAREEWL